MEICEIFEEVRGLELCGSAYEFSQKFLGKHRSYYSVLRARKAELSTSALVALNYAIQREISVLQARFDWVSNESQQRLQAIAGQIVEELNFRSSQNLNRKIIEI